MARDPRSAFDRFLTSSLDDLLAPGESSDGFPEVVTLLRRAADGVPAYGAMLKGAGLGPADILDASDFAKLPLLNKENYVRRFPLEALVDGGDLAACDFFAVSSGSTGEPTLWPRGLHHELAIAVRFEQVLRDGFRARRAAHAGGRLLRARHLGGRHVHRPRAAASSRPRAIRY